ADRAEDESEDEGPAGHVRDQRSGIGLSHLASSFPRFRGGDEWVPQRLEKAARRCLALAAALDFGYLAIRSSRGFCALLRSPIVSWELAMESMASGAFSLSGQAERSLRCAEMACL